MTNYAKSCRICLAEGSRDIFTSMAPPGSGRCDISASSVSRLLEKYRYVTMMQISENDNLPTLICDSCIVELNVAYNFKRQAIDTSIFLQRNAIEMGRATEEAIDVSPSRIFVVPKESPLEVKRELLEPEVETPTSCMASMATNTGSPTTSVASGSSRSMVFVNTNSFPNIGADSTSDKDFVESYLPPKKRGREFQSQLITPTPSPHEIEMFGKPVESSASLDPKPKSRTQNLPKQITLRPRPSPPNYSERKHRTYPKTRNARNLRNTPTDRKTRDTRYQRASLNTTPAGQAINPVAMVKTMLRSRRKRLTVS